ncbi:putative disease resistance RPP13-like protein 1 [Henckelia pumila]|uniref:putative disease resistance RPP13-like protein 1 n=1 Tax=Henckelia pumila TaxID=405737 RepID=UPI003C6E1535
MAYSLFVSGFPSGFGSAFFQFALERLASFGSYAWNEVKLIWGVEDELKKLQKTMLRVQEMVDHVQPFSLMGGSEAWKRCLADTKLCSYDTDAIVDYIYLHIPISVTVRPGELRKKILSPYDLKLPHDINVLQNKLEYLETEINRLLMNEKMKSSLMSPLIDGLFSASSMVDERIVVGRATDKQSCLDLLKLEPVIGNFSVISLVGMAGIGKTTLAQLVYGDKTVDDIFKKKMWVSVSMKFDVIRIMQSIIGELTGIRCTDSDLNSVQVQLQAAIKGFKFLLVLDDYWSEKHDEWDALSSPLEFGSQGSKVIVTTRIAKVSDVIKSFETYNLKHLSEDECWDMMKRRMMERRIPIKELEILEPIGIEIAKKCKGLPLAAKTLASLLSNPEFKANEWHCILKGKLWDLPQDNNDLLPTLMLSYIHLSPQLQKCFAYCSLFPKDHEFEVEELVLLWMAEGFIQPIEGWRLEDVGQQYFSNLCSRSFFQVSNLTKPSRYKMHDLIHDMAQLVSTDICFQVMNMSDRYPLFVDTCHLSILLDSMKIHLEASQKNERLRTFLMINKIRAQEGQLNMKLFTYLQSLRVLDLSRIGLTELTNSIDRLKCLRYLNLSENQIPKLPRSVCNLVALQTLKLKNCEEIHELPDDTKNLSSLRHLDLDKGQLSRMPPDFGRLTNLQSLSAFIVGTKKENGIAQIRDMNLLRGSFCIKNINRVTVVKDADEAELYKKSFLEKLELQWVSSSSYVQPNRQSHHGVVLSCLKPHEDLKELVIDNYCGKIYPDWLCEQNRKLTSIHLQGLKYCERLPPLGQLLYLKSFHISDMPLLGSINDEFYGTANGVKFPSLESFEVRSMSGLTSWKCTDTSTAMPLLSNFNVHDCPNLTTIPANLRGHPGSSISDCANL